MFLPILSDSLVKFLHLQNVSGQAALQHPHEEPKKLKTCFKNANKQQKSKPMK